VPRAAADTLEPAVAEQIRALEDSLAGLANTKDLSKPQLAQAYGELGQLYHAYELIESAEACYRNANRLSPDNYRWVHLGGRLKEAAGDASLAVKLFEDAVNQNPRYTASALHLGDVYRGLNRHDEARKAYQTVLALDPDSAAAFRGLGETALSEQKYAEAVENLTKALELTPQANRLHYSLGMAYRGLGDLDKAKEELARRGPVGVRGSDPLFDEVEALRRGERVQLIQGRMAFAARRYKQAAEFFRKAVEAEPTSARARINLGAALGQSGDLDGALQQYQAVLQTEPNNETARFNTGVLLVRGGKAAEAAEHFQAVVAVSPDDLEANRELAKSLVKSGRAADAIVPYQKVAASDPDDEIALTSLTTLLVNAGRPQEALDLLEKAHEKYPDRGITAHALARILAASPDAKLRDAARALELAKSVFNARQEVFHGETVALALAELGRCEEAAKWQQQLIDAIQTSNQKPSARFVSALERYRKGAPCGL